MNTKWQPANPASQKSSKAVWITVNFRKKTTTTTKHKTKQQHKNLANQLYLIKKIKNKEFGKLVHLVNLAISSYGKFNFSELPLRNI